VGSDFGQDGWEGVVHLDGVAAIGELEIRRGGVRSNLPALNHIPPIDPEGGSIPLQLLLTARLPLVREIVGDEGLVVEDGGAWVDVWDLVERGEGWICDLVELGRGRR